MDLEQLNARVEAYAKGKTWYWYLPLWLFGLYTFYELFRLDMVKQQLPLVLLIPYSFNFFIHEMAHIVTAWLPAVLCASAGSLSELALGVVLVVLAFRQRSYFALLFCFLWFDLACQSAGAYMADAVPQQLQLVSLGALLSGGGEARHDWNFVFGQLHLLWASAFIGDTIRVIGAVGGFLGVIFTAWVMYKMSQAPHWAEGEDEALLRAAHPAREHIPTKSVADEGFTSLPLSSPLADQTSPKRSRKPGDT